MEEWFGFGAGASSYPSSLLDAVLFKSIPCKWLEPTICQIHRHGSARVVTSVCPDWSQNFHTCSRAAKAFPFHCHLLLPWVWCQLACCYVWAWGRSSHAFIVHNCRSSCIHLHSTRHWCICQCCNYGIWASEKKKCTVSECSSTCPKASCLYQAFSLGMKCSVKSYQEIFSFVLGDCGWSCFLQQRDNSQEVEVWEDF